jgi:hypothetical protein
MAALFFTQQKTCPQKKERIIDIIAGRGDPRYR